MTHRPRHLWSTSSCFQCLSSVIVLGSSLHMSRPNHFSIASLHLLDPVVFEPPPEVTCGSNADCIFTLSVGVHFRHTYFVFALLTLHFQSSFLQGLPPPHHFNLQHVFWVFSLTQHDIIHEHYLTRCFFSDIFHQ